MRDGDKATSGAAARWAAGSATGGSATGGSATSGAASGAASSATVTAAPAAAAAVQRQCGGSAECGGSGRGGRGGASGPLECGALRRATLVAVVLPSEASGRVLVHVSWVGDPNRHVT